MIICLENTTENVIGGWKGIQLCIVQCSKHEKYPSFAHSYCTVLVIKNRELFLLRNVLGEVYVTTSGTQYLPPFILITLYLPVPALEPTTQECGNVICPLHLVGLTLDMLNRKLTKR